MFGQQYGNPAALSAKWSFFGFLVIVTMAILLGTNLKDAKWFNSDIAVAEANRINTETAHQQATYKLQEELAQAQTEAEIKEINRQQNLLDAQYEHDIKVLSQDLANRQAAFRTRSTLITMFGGAVSIALIIATILWVGSKALVHLRTVSVVSQSQDKIIPPIEKIIPNQPQWDADQKWQDDDYRETVIAEARKNELVERQRKIEEEYDEVILMERMQSISDPARVENGKYNHLPLAG